MSTRDEQIAKAKALLAEHGFTMSIGGCGCCNSPWVRLRHNDTEVIFAIGALGESKGQPIERDNATFDMFLDAGGAK
jgi:hypothetical protein